MRYSIEPKDRIYVKRYGFLSFAKNMGKNLSSKYGQKLLDNAKKSTTNAIKTASKRAMQKTAESAGDLIGNKIVDKITTVSKKSKKPQKNEANDESEAPKERNISPEKRQQITLVNKDFGAMQLVTVPYGFCGAEFKNHIHFC